MSHIKEADILKALLDEGDDFDVESRGSEPESDVESEHLSVRSDTNSEVDAENKDRKTKYSCKKCYVPICMEHTDFFCQDCGQLTNDDLN